MPFQPLEPKRLYRQIAEQLRALIEAGEFHVGERLPAERDLAMQFNVSRPSVREALIALEVEGWVEIRGGSGVYVRQSTLPVPVAMAMQEAHDEWGPLELIMARGLVEGEVAALAARHASPAQIAGIAAALEQMMNANARGEDALAGDDLFHHRIADACGNEVLRDTVRRYWQARRSPMYLRLGEYFDRPANWQGVLNEHRAVLQAIENHDAKGARKLMQSHMTNAHRRLSASWLRANEPSPSSP
jgi:DNA-binding FadR family transcriptional regulator